MAWNDSAEELVDKKKEKPVVTFKVINRYTIIDGKIVWQDAPWLPPSVEISRS